jgi:hypothetical protein
VVGVAVNGIPIIGAPLALTFDNCMGHTDTDHSYHYHLAPKCLFENLGIPYPCNKAWWFSESPESYWPLTGPVSPLVGHALDGFPIYGPYGADGKLVKESDVDNCNGRTVDGKYGYVMTPFPPYVVGCFTGTPGLTVTKATKAAPLACPKAGVESSLVDALTSTATCDNPDGSDNLSGASSATVSITATVVLAAAALLSL